MGSNMRLTLTFLLLHSKQPWRDLKWRFPAVRRRATVWSGSLEDRSLEDRSLEDWLGTPDEVLPLGMFVVCRALHCLSLEGEALAYGMNYKPLTLKESQRSTHAG